MELSQLETFLAVAEERSFSRAAVRLHRTQPAVSQVIRKLEAAVGETLFDRAARDGSLTAAGELLRDYAQRLLALRREAVKRTRRVEEPGARAPATGRQRVHLHVPAAGDRPVPAASIPQIGVTVHRMLASRIPEELNLRTFEIGVMSFRPDPEQFRTIAVYSDSLALIVSPRSSTCAGRARVDQRSGQGELHCAQCDLAAAQESD